ncbi:hypothetical protein [Xanthobacter autotrophicus]|uniref:hypothetical protein n=1 Tax=Xanthobacter autotrophicus TaxID=280 RepID=UPI00372A6B32
MDAARFLVTLLVIGVPLAMFFALRRTKGTATTERPGAPTAPERRPPVDFGMARESHSASAPTTVDQAAPTPAPGAAAAAAGGAFILAVESARQHAGESGSESSRTGQGAGQGGSGPDSGADSGNSGA